MSRGIVVAASLAVLGLAGWASWTGVGASDGAGTRSVRTGSPGVILLPGGGIGRGGAGGGTGFGVK